MASELLLAVTNLVWDLGDGRRLPLVGHKSGVSSAEFSPGGERIVTAGWDGTAIVWDAATGKQLLPPLEHGYPATLSPDGKRILTSGRDPSLQLWDATTGKKLQGLNSDGGWVHSAAFSKDGKWIVSASADRKTVGWDANTGKPLRTLLGHTESVSSAAFSPDGKSIVTASKDRTVRIWDTTTGQLLLVLQGLAEHAPRAIFSPDGTQIVVHGPIHGQSLLYPTNPRAYYNFGCRILLALPKPTELIPGITQQDYDDAISDCPKPPPK